jgi:hypothetical protein
MHDDMPGLDRRRVGVHRDDGVRAVRDHELHRHAGEGARLLPCLDVPANMLDRPGHLERVAVVDRAVGDALREQLELGLVSVERDDERRRNAHEDLVGGGPL